MNENTIQARMFGWLDLSCGDVVVSSKNNRSRKVKNLLSYLVYNWNRMVSIDELICVLDNDRKDSAPIAALRTTLHRVRRVIEPLEKRIGQSLIITENGMYGWNPKVKISLDVVEFETMCRANLSEDAVGAECFKRTLALYRGDFLAELAAEQWVEPKAEYYRDIYLSAVEDAVPVCMKEGLSREAVDYCRNAIHISPYSESMYCCLMQAYAALGDNESAAKTYEKLRALLYEDLGIIPGEEARRIYQEIFLCMSGDALAPDIIRNQLQEYAMPSGALICDYTSFKLFYQAEARAAARRGDAIHIGVLSVLSRNGKMLPSNSLERAMGQLRNHISISLRTGDIASCCSSSQYILMLLQANYENSKTVCERVVHSFFRSYPQSPIRIQTAVFPLEPTA